ncbi:MAG: hypothetical protein ACI4M5_06260 [Christensenellales bacterium]
MIKVRTKILIMILLTAVALVGVAVLCLGNGAMDEGQQTTDIQSSVKVVNTSTPTIEIVPTFWAGLVSSTDEPLEFHLDGNTSITYHGVIRPNWYNYFVKWEEPYANANVKYVLTFEDENGVDMGYRVTYDNSTWTKEITKENGMAPCNVGKYTVKIEVESDTYYVAESNATKQFEITPFEITIYDTSANNKTYNGMSHEVKVKAEPDVSFGDKDMYNTSYQVEQNGEWVDMPADEKPINAGSYKVILHFAENKNYIFNQEEFTGEFTISRAPLNVDYVLPSELTYNRTDWQTQPEVTGWLYNTANGERDSGECTLVITKGGQVVDKMVTVGEYVLSMICDNPNYYIPTNKTVNIVKKTVDVDWVVDNQVVYDGNTHTAEAVMTGVVDGDDVSVNVRYYDEIDGEIDLPINAGRYSLDCTFGGTDKDNYEFVMDRSKAYINIEQAEYAIDDFEVRLYDKKIIVIETDFGGIEVSFSLGGTTWQSSNELEGRPMQEYQVMAKLAESRNYKQKILTKTVRTGFDAELFDQMMKDVDIEGFSFKDVSKYREIERCLTYVAEGSLEENVDMQYLNQVRDAYVEYKELAQEVTEQAMSLSGAIIVKYAVGAIGALGVLGLTIARRKKDEI